MPVCELLRRYTEERPGASGAKLRADRALPARDIAAVERIARTADQCVTRKRPDAIVWSREDPQRILTQSDHQVHLTGWKNVLAPVFADRAHGFVHRPEHLNEGTQRPTRRTGDPVEPHLFTLARKRVAAVRMLHRRIRPIGIEEPSVTRPSSWLSQQASAHGTRGSEAIRTSSARSADAYQKLSRSSVSHRRVRRRRG